MSEDDPPFSDHARKRLQQRGIREGDARYVIEHADSKVSRPLNKNRIRAERELSIGVSRRKLALLAKKGEISPQLVEKLDGVRLLVAISGDEVTNVVTVMHKKKRSRY